MKRIRWDIAVLVIVLLIYGGLLMSRFAPAISEPDDNGYFAQGSLLVESGRTWFKPASDAQYIGMHWLVTADGKYISRYPPGLAVVIGAVYAIGGWKAATLVNPALSVLALIGVFQFARRLGLTGAWAIACVILLAANPTFVQHALSGDSHMSVTCALAWGLYWLIRWSQDEKIWQAFIAGIVLGCIPTIRYPDSIVAVAIIVFIFWQARRIRGFGLHMLAAMGGAAIPIVPLLIRNQLLLGAFWRTGYSLTNEQTGFGLGYFREHALQYVPQLNSTGLGLTFALGLVGMVTMICLSKWRSVGVLFGLINVPMLLLYMAYYWAGNTMRFMLPTFPAYVLAGVWAMKELTASAPRAAKVAVPVVIVVAQLLWSVPGALSQGDRLRSTHAALAMVTDALDETAQRGDVVIADMQLAQQLDFVRHWKVADASLVSGRGRPGGGPPGGGGRPGMGPGAMEMGEDAPSPMQSEKREARAALYPGSVGDREQKFAADVRAWAGNERIYLVGGEADVKRMLGDAVTSHEIEIIRRINLPETPRPPRRDGFMGGPMPGGPGVGGGPPGGGGGAFRPRGRGGFGGPMGGPGGGPGGGGPGGMGFPDDLKEIVIAQWKPAKAKPST